MSIMSEGEYRYNMLIKTFASQPEPGFESKAQQKLVWGKVWGCDNDVGRLRVVLMHRPGKELDIVDRTKRLPGIGAFGDVKKGWYWRGDELPDLPVLQKQHAGLVKALRAEGVEVVFLNRCALSKMKACYTRDPVIAINGGAVVMRMGPPIRRGEEAPVTETLAKLGMPILRTIHGTGIMEGGSFAFINPKTAVIGLSSRVNEEAARQLEEVLRVQGVELIRVHLTGYRLHIDGAFVMIDVDTAIINPTQLPFWFLEKLKEMKLRCIEVHPDDPVFTINCLAVRPGRIIMNEGVSPRTLDKLDRAGISVVAIPYDKMYLGGGGIHCSTAPLIRDPL
ncbi:MAG: amidinotransferase [Alphaproteobacteria bacterium]|nr:amidinotransferase [Alphaproteobacteria bacterium]